MKAGAKGSVACDANRGIDPVLAVRNLEVVYPLGQGRNVKAVSGVSFELQAGETLGLVGESGCGKSSIARAIMQLPRPLAGEVLFNGRDLVHLPVRELRRLRPQFQMIFQDSPGAFNPRRRVEATIAAPLKFIGSGKPAEAAQKARAMMRRVGLPAAAFHRRPHEFSGGQCQRIQIARALITHPKLLICDEPVSSLDVSVQAQILNLLEAMRRALGLTVLFISHDLAVVKNMSDRVAVMYLGRLCEIAPADRLYAAPAHPYTRALLAAIPQIDPQQPAASAHLLPGEITSPTEPPSGCRFRTRCPRARALCAETEPPLEPIEPGHRVACHFHQNNAWLGKD